MATRTSRSGNNPYDNIARDWNSMTTGSRGGSSGSSLAGAAASGAVSGALAGLNRRPSGSGSGSSSGGSGSASGSVSYQEGPDISRYYEDLIDSIRAQQRAEEQRKQAAINQGVNTLSAQKPVLEQQYQDAAQQAYIQMMQSRKALPQVMGAQGLSGGLSESSLVDLDASYGQNLNALRQQRDQGLAGIDSDIANLRATGDLSLADTASQYAQLLGDLAREQMAAAQEERLKYTVSGQQSGGSGGLSYAQAQARGLTGGTANPDGGLTPNAQNWINLANRNLSRDSAFLTVNGYDQEGNLAQALLRAYQQGQLSRAEAQAVAGHYGFTLNI